MDDRILVPTGAAVTELETDGESVVTDYAEATDVGCPVMGSTAGPRSNVSSS